MTTDALATTSKESTAAAIYQSPAAILRPTTARYPELGRIRAGIKIIKRQWNQATGKADLPPDAKDQGIYNKMMDAGASWDDIERAINPAYFTEANAKNHKVKRKLIPVNIPYFFCRPIDCKDPANASKLADLYGDKEDHNRIKAFPVVFYSNLWWENIDSSDVCHSAEAVRFRSQIIVASSDSGLTGKRMCMIPPPPVPGVRPSGVDREWIPRPNTKEYSCDGECKPEKCPQYQAKECNLSATIRCYIPGVHGHGLWQITTHSWYGSTEIAKVMTDTASITRGRLSLLHLNGKPVFELRKVQREVYQIDTTTGKPKKRKQFIPVLNTTVDEFELAMYFEQAAISARGRAAVALFNGTKVEDTRALTTSVIETPSPASAPIVAGSSPEEAFEALDEDEIDAGTAEDIIDIPVEETGASTGLDPDLAPTLREDQIESAEYAALQPEERMKRLEEIKAKIKTRRNLISQMEPKKFAAYTEQNKVFTSSSLVAFERYLAGLEALVALPV